MTEKEKRTEKIMLRILPSVKADAQELAESEGRTLSNYIEHLLIEEINKNKAK